MEIEKVTRLVLTTTEDRILEDAIALLSNIQAKKFQNSSLCPNIVIGQIDDAIGVIEEILAGIKIVRG